MGTSAKTLSAAILAAAGLALSLSPAVAQASGPTARAVGLAVGQWSYTPATSGSDPHDCGTYHATASGTMLVIPNKTPTKPLGLGGRFVIYIRCSTIWYQNVRTFSGPGFSCQLGGASNLVTLAVGGVGRIPPFGSLAGPCQIGNQTVSLYVNSYGISAISKSVIGGPGFITIQPCAPDLKLDGTCPELWGLPV
jgi:hypothetical protein